ncbi:MAG TPA: N-acetylmuramoyl-L-alanine amidase [Candidatus Coprenecus stercoravium]|uniref:N-acetylmuramoyl-L-alanine amidase n=1 Tax=Candidatus Coprenecus stercoravium TaxID=2840735 RepID=A0A9D2KAE4_9BACT|nr:N-acetylmuramoyl-L-alanine amidase [Candidatus Coprenecus stercoravium]
MRYLLSAIFAAAACGISWAESETAALRLHADSVNAYLSKKASITSTVEVDTFYIKGRCLEICLTNTVKDYPLRAEDISAMEDILRTRLPEEYRNHRISLTVDGEDIGRYISGYMSGNEYRGHKLKPGRRWISSPLPSITEGLNGRNIALWASHGYYYSNNEDRWKWQRAPFFTTVEDLLTQSIVTGFLAPMLENAGAHIVMPRERDIQTCEIVVDNGSPYYSETDSPETTGSAWKDSPRPGFSDTADFYLPGENPFASGTARMAECSSKSHVSASYTPDFPESGNYAVYISYQSLPGSSDAIYTVIHSGGEKHFTVDQSMGGGMWVYLGTFHFTKGDNRQGVSVSNKGKGIITTDAVRFGGGYGNIIRGSRTSGVPKYAEAARYWLQWSGFPESIYSPNTGTDDYKDDYMSRGAWVNYMKDSLNIPIDAAVAIHTDAGSTIKDSIIGTLAIYKEESEGSRLYTDGSPRITARELADIVQTSIVDDIRKHYRSDWTRRGLWDRSYVEARVPDIPTVLIELLSHQNYQDMQCALDPEFKFIVSRAIYKGILRYMSYISGGKPYTVQPLPVRNLNAAITDKLPDRAAVHLTWSPRQDTDDPSAEPDSYIVYRRVTDISDSETPGFDNGTPVSSSEYTDTVAPGRIYSYKIVAVNKGGISFPSEILSAGYLPDAKTALVVNGFTDVSAALPYLSDIAYIGAQYGFDRSENWIHDDRPGYGASYMDYGPAPVAGNNFDYPLIHGKALMRNGLSFCSISLESLTNAQTDISAYEMLDLMTGNSALSLNDTLMSVIGTYLRNGGNLLISGSGIGKSVNYDFNKEYPLSQYAGNIQQTMEMAATTLYGLKDSIERADTSLTGIIDSTACRLSRLSATDISLLYKALSSYSRKNDPSYTSYRFAADTLGYIWSNGNASSLGGIISVRNHAGIFPDTTAHLSFPTGPNPDRFYVQSPDAILPSGPASCTFLRYTGSNTSAATAFEGDGFRCVSIGFPIEALTSQQQADDLMCEVIEFLFR